MQNKTAANAWAFEILILDSLIKLKKELKEEKEEKEDADDKTL